MSERKFAAILLSDIVEYSELASKDIKKAKSIRKESIKQQQYLVESHRGEWMGAHDSGNIAQFHSELDAIKCALDIQQNAPDGLDEKLRIGIHLEGIDENCFTSGIHCRARRNLYIRINAQRFDRPT